MVSYTFTLPAICNLQQLRDEVLAVASPTSVARVGNQVTLTFDSNVDIAPIEQALTDHVPSEIADFDGLVAKARDVWAGNDTFTQAQAQKILAGLVLIVARYLR